MRGSREDLFWTIVVCTVYVAVCMDSALQWLNDRKRHMHLRSQRPPILGIPHRTQLYAIVRKNKFWQVWTGIDNMQAPYTEWTGTNIECHDDGTAWKVVVQPDGVEDRYQVM